jgi:probable rRNA maturation factor
MCLTVLTLNKNRQLVIDVADEQSLLTVDPARIRLAVERVLKDARIDRAQLSVALVDDQAIHNLNRRYLRHDYATDVLSFVLERSPEFLDGQIVVSAETARREAARYGWSPEDELLLYVVHGALHLAGCDDTTPERRTKMRERENAVLDFFGLKPRRNRIRTSDCHAPEDEAS